MNNETYEIITWHRVHTLRELQDALDKLPVAGEDEISIDGIDTVTLVEKTLTDGEGSRLSGRSKVLDVRLYTSSAKGTTL